MKTEIIKDFPNYRINTLGEIESCYKGTSSIATTNWKPIKQVYDKSCGYMLVTLCHKGVRKNKRVHRLLMESFIPNEHNKQHINHIDGNKLNNSLSNLEWVTPKENAVHAANTGLLDVRTQALEVPILMYEKDKITFIKEYKSFHEIERDLHICWQNVWKVCNDLRHTAGGFHWKYKNV